MNIYIAPLKFFSTALLSFIIKELRLILNTEVSAINIDVDIENSYSKERAQYYSTQIISESVEKTENYNGRVVILTEADLYIPVLTYVFGEAQLNGKHSIVSVCRLHEEFYSEKSDENLLRERTMKEILHELGHNFGLRHCIDWDCVMHSSTSIEEVDIKGNYYCKNCEKRILSA